MTITLILSVIIMLSVFLMIVSAVVFVGQKKFFSSAPKDIQAAIIDRDERFAGARLLGYLLMAISVAACVGAVIYAGYDGVAKSFSFGQFFCRYAGMLYLYLLFDIVVLDYFLLTKSHFYQHFYPETIGCAGYHSFGFNRKEKILTAIAICIASAILAFLCRMFV